ncbi:MAG: S-layer homology domain-containing protein [Deltaproteobacteria bacterium]
MNWRAGHWYRLVAMVLALCFAMAQPVLADANIRVIISDPDNPSAGPDDSNTVASAGSAPDVAAGENQVLGTLSITGKTGVQVPVQAGDRIKISLSPGVCYMRTPSSTNYRNYVTWPSQVGSEKNQICDSKDRPGMIFECATPHSLILRVGNIDSSARAMLLCFRFDQPDYSCVRVAPFVGIADEWASDSKTKVTRLDFFKLFLTVAPERYIGRAEPPLTMEQKFSDLGDVDILDKEVIRPLVDSYLIRGYAGGLFKPHAYVSRNEAFAVAGRAFGYLAVTSFQDKVAGWGDASINYGARRILYWGEPDGTFGGQKALTRAEALKLLQSCFETRSVGSNRLQGQDLGFR